jgi:hypothetical protein
MAQKWLISSSFSLSLALNERQPPRKKEGCEKQGGAIVAASPPSLPLFEAVTWWRFDI